MGVQLPFGTIATLKGGCVPIVVHFSRGVSGDTRPGRGVDFPRNQESLPSSAESYCKNGLYLGRGKASVGTPGAGG
jgi:hypothetical protein